MVVLVVVTVVVVVSLLCSSRWSNCPRHIVAGSSSHFCHRCVTRGGTSSHLPTCPVHCAEELVSSTNELWLMPCCGWLSGWGSGDDMENLCSQWKLRKKNRKKLTNWVREPECKAMRAWLMMSVWVKNWSRLARHEREKKRYSTCLGYRTGPAMETASHSE